MAPKRSANLAPAKGQPTPPAASSSDEDDEETTSSSPPPASPPPSKKKPPHSKPPKKPKPSPTPANIIPQPTDRKSSSSDEDDSSDNEAPSKFTIKPSKPTAAADSDSSSSSESDSPPPSQKTKTVKPISTKPMDTTKTSGGEQSKAKKSSASATPAKRALVGSDNEEPAAKKMPFQRLWSGEDEAKILKGMGDYIRKGKDPVADMAGFFNFIKESLKADCKQAQLTDKIRRLKKKFETSLARVKEGKEPAFSKPQEKIAFELSRAIWGSKQEEANIGGEATVKDNGKVNDSASFDGKDGSRAKDSAISDGKNGSPAKGGRRALPNVQAVAVENASGGEVRSGMLFSRLKESGLCEDLVKEGLSLLDASKVAEYEDEWKKLQIMEVEIQLKRADLVKKQMKAILEALKKTRSQRR